MPKEKNTTLKTKRENKELKFELDTQSSRY